jgi:hypothetical protein
MTDVLTLSQGGYRFIKGVFQYSAGVAAEPGFEIVRARFANVLPLAEGFARIERHLSEIDRPVSAFCACELRSPKPFDDAGFRDFNRSYVEPLQGWGLIRDGINPIARSNVCPELAPPPEPGFHAFCYTVSSGPYVPKSFMIAGSGEAPEGLASYGEQTVRPGDRSPDAIREKSQWVLGEMERRMGAFGFTWRHSTACQLYTVYDFHHVMANEIVRRGAANAGVTWHFCRPPVDVLDYEMDVRGIRQELVI